MNAIAIAGQSPFDAIRQTRPDGTEFWSARDLMNVEGYQRWEKFKTGLSRAMATAKNQGHDVDSNFRRSEKVSGSRGPAAEDYELSRFAAYLVAMNGEPNMPAVAQAQAYFAIQTRVAETTPALTGEELLAHAVLEAASTIKRIDAERLQLAAKVEHDAPLVAKAEAHSASTTSINRQDFAREVQTWGKKIHGIWIRQKHVMAFLAHKGMTVRGERSDAGQATATAIRNGWAENSKYTDETTGRSFVTTRLLPKGQDVAWKWITSYVEANGTLELPRQIHGGDAA
ncbi:phage antirepressor KilAC domain-containing protein [Rhodococcus rhodochrous]|uniref:phage antirepressor KilAC domain-containing protein n=1 Tax=Rhodococcus rhodochrous TaxID=1829 RepID=UPI001E344810|nr:phage antirepressor KilAC domain-containing protein [Rhodococcus rhodochrous]MCD2096571.1 phage antirepressor KilAC domain-containing protein [Rhodococcus rhodochrous]MCD2121211.1 phage antirepressor KilAC domain-containing protein [Rhodococcus rhodochrous]MCQ4137304.1 phage antirepressor KilAC domain-containing protein [Rhodococcus rhodochrous]MDJ0021203.1 phage antirepressor KilAC domain-containing protein [Rhodococcus rhodochrous]